MAATAEALAGSAADLVDAWLEKEDGTVAEAADSLRNHRDQLEAVRRALRDDPPPPEFADLGDRLECKLTGKISALCGALAEEAAWLGREAEATARRAKGLRDRTFKEEDAAACDRKTAEVLRCLDEVSSVLSEHSRVMTVALRKGAAEAASFRLGEAERDRLARSHTLRIAAGKREK